jgi:microcystin-dependent protein
MGYLGEIRMFAGTFVPSGWAQCDGSTLPIQEYGELAEIIGKTYGGDGFTTFGLPNLGTNAPVHRSGVYPMGQTSSGALGVEAASSASMLFLIALTAPEDFPPLVGEVRTFGFGAVPNGWALCDGSILNVADNTLIYSVVQNQYGGSSEQGTFALPDLRANTVHPVSSTDPLGYVVMSYCIATTGVYPSRS